MYLQTRVTLRSFPVATPRGRSSSSHGGETLFLVVNMMEIYKKGIQCLIYNSYTVKENDCSFNAMTVKMLP